MQRVHCQRLLLSTQCPPSATPMNSAGEEIEIASVRLCNPRAVLVHSLIFRIIVIKVILNRLKMQYYGVERIYAVQCEMNI